MKTDPTRATVFQSTSLCCNVFFGVHRFGRITSEGAIQAFAKLAAWNSVHVVYLTKNCCHQTFSAYNRRICKQMFATLQRLLVHTVRWQPQGGATKNGVTNNVICLRPSRCTTILSWQYHLPLSEGDIWSMVSSTWTTSPKILGTGPGSTPLAGAIYRSILHTKINT